MVDQQALELFAGVLASPVGVMQQGLRLAATPDRHRQSIDDQLCAMLALIDQPTTRREKRSSTAAT